MSHQSAIFMSSIINFGKRIHKGIGEMNQAPTHRPSSIAATKSVSDCEQ